MIDPANPYLSPTSTDSFGGDNVGAAVQTSDRAIELLARTRPWVKVMVVVGRIGLIFMAIGLVALVLIALTQGNAGVGQDNVPPLFLAAMYAVMLVLYWFPVLFLSQYTSKIRQLTTTAEPALLDEALDAQRKFWKFIGIGMLVMIAIYVLFILGAVLLGIAVQARS